MTDFAPHMSAVARHLFGKPSNSTPSELRFGQHGSMSVDLTKGTWFDHEVKEGGGVLDLVKRETGLANGDAVAWLDNELGMRFETDTVKPVKSNIVAKYDYHDASGELVMQVCRLEPKSFRQRCPDGRGGWVWSVKGVEPFPYRLPQVLAAIEAKQPVFVVEGEKDADRLSNQGATATCNPGGAGKWPDSFAKYLTGARVILIPDNDEAGRDHMEQVAHKLHGTAHSIVRVMLEGLRDKGDVSDWLDAGHTRDELADLVADAREWEPTPGQENRLGKRIPFNLFDSIEPTFASNDFVEELLIDGQFSLLYGESGTGKTFFATDLALHVSLGWTWRNRHVEKGAVLYVAAEGGNGVRNRIAAFKAHHDVSSAPFAVAPQSIDLLNDDGDADAVIEAIGELMEATDCPVRLVVIDTLSRALSGGDENSSADMGALVGNVDKIRKATGVHVLVVHHSGKDTAKGARGHSLLRAAVDSEIEVKRPEGEKVGTAIVRKQRDIECIGQFGYRLESVELGANDRGQPITSCVVVDANPPPSARGAVRLSDEQRAFFQEVKNALADHAANVVPESGMRPVSAVSRNHLRNRLVAGGIIDDAAASNQKSGLIQSYLRKLKGKGLLGVSREYVWLVE